MNIIWYIILNIACRFYKSWQYLVECSFSQCSRIHFFLDVIAFILWLRDDFCQFWSQWMVDNIWISNGSPLAVAKKVHGSKFGKCAQSQCMSDWAGKTRGVWHVARWMADSSNFGTQTLCLTRWGAVGDGLIYFSENCHSGIFFGLACAVFLHLFTVVAIMFNLGVFCSDTYKVTLIKIRMFKKLPCLARVFWSFKNCDALICCDPCLPIGSPPLLHDPPLKAKCDWDKLYFFVEAKASVCTYPSAEYVYQITSASGGRQEGERSARQ